MIVLSSHEAVKGVFWSQQTGCGWRISMQDTVLTEPPKNFLIADQLYTGG
jgi:hypothetical protein